MNNECYFCTDYCDDADFCVVCEEYICDECWGDVDDSIRHTLSEHESVKGCY